MQQNQHLQQAVARIFGQVDNEHQQVFQRTLHGIYLSGFAFFVTLVFIAAPFGRFYNSKWGPAIPGKLSWLTFERYAPPRFDGFNRLSVPWITFTYFFFYPWSLANPSKRVDLTHNVVTWMYLTMFLTHYLHRSLVYTYMAPAMGPNTLIAIVIAIVFNIANGTFECESADKQGYCNARWITLFGSYPESTLQQPIVQAGLVVFWLGMFINIRSDYILFALRRNKTATQRYSIPLGFMYKYISCPNYFGEILEWLGWAMVTNWSPAAVAFVVFTFANLFPRALKTHEWYKSTFGESYPRTRKAIIPGLL